MPTLLKSVAALLGALVCAAANAQTYPSRNILVISPVAGGVAEAYMRLVLDKAKENTGATFIYEPRPGGGAAPALQQTKKAAPDGYTYGISWSSATTMNPLINKDLGLDVLKDFVPVANLMGLAVVIAAREEFPGKDIRDLIAMAKAKPDQVRIATFGAANVAALVMIEEKTGAKLAAIPYKTTNEAITATMGGHIEGYFETVSGALAYKGKLKPLVYLGPVAIPQLPGVPLTRDLYGFDMMNWFGVLAPAGTPASAVGWMSRELIKAVNDPAVKGKLESGGYSVLGHNTEEFTKTLRNELTQNAELLRKYPQIK